eukprot:CAMPEP_0174975692 /NCGR_PEP_ID=MMETSP0004_2-20121128/12592_1 /TAXON_ID=420556 /ORGANISM="Ochromonas sp., Strain CCMP1393" /LENGTH=867 /DNA_ID=CAMNT_0016226587 /DNA_START=128 /DNA_END=2731 /DNA_ORIENTATION=-
MAAVALSSVEPDRPAQLNNVEEDLPLPTSTHELGQHRHRISQRRPQDRIRELAEGDEKAGLEPEISPLFPGYGTHFSYIYVGTPPQRQSVIVDTGSHYTAFPCKGCKKCGKHTDMYWDPKNSSTATTQQCGGPGDRCIISQSYSEGSSWKAYKVKDKLWVGGMTPARMPHASSYAMDFVFGCQTEETGLFQSQLADGIMGMSDAADTLPRQLQSRGVTPNTRAFALCLRVGGGILTLGGVDTKIHTKNTIDYARMVKHPSNGWFGVNLLSVGLRTGPSAAAAAGAAGDTMLPANGTVYNSGNGAILDSGTTDTYLPKQLLNSFKRIFKQMSGGGVEYSEKDMKLTTKQLQALPTIVFKLQRNNQQGATKPVEVLMPLSNYLDKVGPNTYNMRIVFSEKSGTVLGGNFMTGYNVIFDPEKTRIGMAHSLCNYEEFDPAEEDPGHVPAGPALGEDGDAVAKEDGSTTDTDGSITAAAGSVPCVDEMIPTSECTAVCDRNETAYVATGSQKWVHKCAAEMNPPPAEETRPCSEKCSAYKIVRGDPKCPDKPWTDCTHACLKSRQMVPLTEPTKVRGKCNYHLQTSTCYAGSCPQQDGDYLVYIDLRVRLEPWKWSYVYTESFYSAMTTLLKLKGNSVELLNDAGNEYTLGTKLHFKIRLKAKDFKDVTAMHDFSDKIVMAVRHSSFGTRLVRTLDETARHIDGQQLSRFGWMYGEDIEVLSAIAMPIGGIRDPFGLDNRETGNEMGGAIGDGGDSLTAEKINLILLGVALAAVVILGVVVYLHMRLRNAHALYEKDKAGGLSQGGQVLLQSLNQVSAQVAAAVTGGEVKEPGAGAAGRTGGAAGGDIELASQKKGLMQGDDDLIDEDLAD